MVRRYGLYLLLAVCLGDQVLDKKWLDIVTFDREFYGIPIEAATFGLIVNTTLFYRHGIKYPTDWPTTRNGAACGSTPLRIPTALSCIAANRMLLTLSKLHCNLDAV